MIRAKAIGGRFTLVSYGIFLALVAMTGGSSRFDAGSQPVVRVAAILLMMVLGLRAPARQARAIRPAFGFMAAIALAIAIQLVPLPPALWSALPGHSRYIAAAIAAGEAQPWRPINLAPDRGWNALFALLPPAAALMAASRLRMRDQSKVLLILLAIVIASAVIGLAQVSAGMDDTLRFYAAPPTGSAVGLFANRNHQALLLACGFPMLALWADHARSERLDGRIHALLAGVSLLFLLLMIPTTGSRAGLALATIALPIAAVLGWRAAGDAVRSLPAVHRRMIVGGGVLLFAAALAAALTFARAEAVHRLFSADPVEDARVKLLRPLLAMIREFFPLGTGFGSFDPVYRGFEPFLNLSVTFMNQAHDDYLQLILEGGLPALVLLCLFVGWWIWASWTLWRRRGEGTGMGRLGSTILLLIMLASVTDYPIRTPLMMVIAAQSAGWMLAALARYNRAAFS